MHWMLMPLRRYADFEGRSQRKEYWMFALLNVLIACVVYALMGLSFAVMNESEVMTPLISVFILYGLWGLAILIPAFAVAVRRLHDTDRSGWNILWGLVPIVGGLILLYFYVTDGTPGPNRFGPDPKGRAAA